MRAFRYLIPAILSASITLTNAWGAAVRQDNSSILVWAFLGFCAIIVLLQLVPALLMLFGFMKGFTPNDTEQAAQDEQ